MEAHDGGRPAGDVRSDSEEKFNQLCQFQTDSFSLEFEPSITILLSSWLMLIPATRGRVPATSTTTGPPLRTFTLIVPTISSNFTALPLKVLAGQTVQSLFPAMAGRMSNAATAAPPRNDLPRLFI